MEKVTRPRATRARIRLAVALAVVTAAISAAVTESAPVVRQQLFGQPTPRRRLVAVEIVDTQMA